MSNQYSFTNEKTYIIRTENSVAYIDKESLDVSFYSGNKILSSVKSPVFEKYSIYKYTGGKSEITETVDGVKATAVDGEKLFVTRQAVSRWENGVSHS